MIPARKYEVGGTLVDNRGDAWVIEDFRSGAYSESLTAECQGRFICIPVGVAELMTYEPPKPKEDPDVWISESAWSEMQTALGVWPGTEAIEKMIQSLHGKPSEWVRKADVADVLVDSAPPEHCTQLWAKLEDIGITPDMAEEGAK